MIRLAVLGASGRLGRRVVALAPEHGVEIVAALASPGSAAIGADAGLLAGVGATGLRVVEASPGALGAADVLLDVSRAGGLERVADGLDGRPLVSGVTGLDASAEALLDRLAAHEPVLHATNFSLGLAVLADLVARASAALPTYDVEIVEAHHRHKADAPSGTAWTLAEAAAEARGLVAREVAVHGRDGLVGARGSREIGMHAVRGGDVIGEHTVWLAGDGERLQLAHVASSRDTFARGALRAARWIVGRPAGRCTIRQVLGLDGRLQADGQSSHGG